MLIVACCLHNYSIGARLPCHCNPVEVELSALSRIPRGWGVHYYTPPLCSSAQRAFDFSVFFFFFSLKSRRRAADSRCGVWRAWRSWRGAGRGARGATPHGLARSWRSWRCRADEARRRAGAAAIGAPSAISAPSATIAARPYGGALQRAQPPLRPAYRLALRGGPQLHVQL